MFAAFNPRQRVTGTPLENVAEEVLNGLFCHYEPPTSEFAQHKAATKAKLHPERYSFSQVKKTQSILRTSRLFRKKQAIVEVPKKKAVTWRDEKNRKGLEGRVESCAVNNCGFLGLSSTGGEGLADSMSPTMAKPGPSTKENKNHTPEPILKPTPTSREPLKEGPPKKVLYDDEGNPISEDNSIVPNENQGAVPAAPTGLSQLRKMARQLGDDVYEPDDYDQSENIRAPVRKATPRHTGNKDDPIELQRSSSPPSNMPPNHYDTPEQFEEREEPSQGRMSSRPGTPYRQRANGKAAEYTHEESSIVDHGERESKMISPSRRSDVFSDLTMDEALSGRSSFRYPASPAKTSEGVEVDVFKGRARPRSRSPSRYHDDKKASRGVTRDNESADKQSFVYDDMGNVERRSAIEEDISVLPKKISRDEKIDKRRRHSLTEPPKVDETLDTSGPRKYSRSRRISEPLPALSRSRKKDDGFQQVRKVAERTTMLPVVETVHSPEEESAARRRDPTPRMSLELARGEENEPANKSPLPPTPRRKDEDHRYSHGSKQERRAKDEDPRSRLYRSIREGLQHEDERRANFSRSREARITEAEEYLPPPSAAPRPQPTTNGHPAPSMYDWTYKNVGNPLSPRTAATDDEIRAEVSSVGMESNTLRPMGDYHNPFFKASQSTIKEDKVEADASTLSHSTGSSHEKQPHTKARSRGEGYPEPVKTSTGSGSTRTKKLWKGWKKAVGKVKQIVKDIDEQRIPPPVLPGYSLQPVHPKLER